MCASRLQVAYYADDFTGATDALESLALAGLRTRLFLDPPKPAQLRSHGRLDAIGVAGFTRSLSPTALHRVLRPALIALRQLRPRFVHYKVCSTFDSSPRFGSIGRALEIGRNVFRTRTVPLLAAAPALGRHCVFGTLFARYGIGSDGAIHRLDRHPSVSRHPVTPMTEADLRRHLAAQTKLRIELINLLELRRPNPIARARLQDALRAGAEVILFDALQVADLPRVAELVEELSPASSPLFTVGSSGMGTVLATLVQPGALRPVRTTAPLPRLKSPLLVLSGSCSPVTAGQIDRALAAGFVGIPIRPNSHAISKILATLRTGKHVIAYTARGPIRGRAIDARILGPMLGRIGREVLSTIRLQRLVVAGGDTSSYAGRALGIESLDLLARFVPGAPLCRAHAPGSPAHDLEVNFKGGQVGAPDYFLQTARQ